VSAGKEADIPTHDRSPLGDGGARTVLMERALSWDVDFRYGAEGVRYTSFNIYAPASLDGPREKQVPGPGGKLCAHVQDSDTPDTDAADMHARTLGIPALQVFFRGDEAQITLSLFSAMLHVARMRDSLASANLCASNQLFRIRKLPSGPRLALCKGDTETLRGEEGGSPLSKETWAARDGIPPEWLRAHGTDAQGAVLPPVNLVSVHQGFGACEAFTGSPGWRPMGPVELDLIESGPKGQPATQLVVSCRSTWYPEFRPLHLQHLDPRAFFGRVASGGWVHLGYQDGQVPTFTFKFLASSVDEATSFLESVEVRLRKVLAQKLQHLEGIRQAHPDAWKARSELSSADSSATLLGAEEAGIPGPTERRAPIPPCAPATAATLGNIMDVPSKTPKESVVGPQGHGCASLPAPPQGPAPPASLLSGSSDIPAALSPRPHLAPTPFVVQAAARSKPGAHSSTRKTKQGAAAAPPAPR
jgi:hypothetical protein